MTMSSTEAYFHRLEYGPPFKPGEEMQYELLRLASFDKWPISAVKRPGELTANGFYYTGSGDLVKCFSCCGKIENWLPEDDIAEKHRSLSPHCPFVKCEDKENKPIGGCNEVTNSLTKEPATEGAHDKIAEVEQPMKEMKSVFVGSPQGSSTNGNTNLEPQVPASSIPDQAMVKLESYRLETFNGRWPHSSASLPRRLAKAGFYYSGPGDRVVCAFCNGKLEAWQPTDDPFDEHQKQFPHCTFINGIPMGSKPEIATNINRSQVQPETAKKQLGTEQLGVVVDKPRFPIYATELARLDTFQKWPKKLAINPIEIVKAGFFYVGYADDVKCFYCGGAIRQWESGADPWLLHALWFSKCGFLKLNKGNDYIKEVFRQNSPNVDTNHSRAAISNINSNNNLSTNVNKTNEMRDGEAANFIQEGNSTISGRRKRKNRKDKMSGVNEEPNGMMPSSGDERNDEKDGGIDPEKEVTDHLQDEYQRLEQEKRCKICMDAMCDIVFLPCGHIVCCSTCSPALRICPICRTVIKGSVRVYFP